MLKGAGTLTKAVFGALRITKIQVRLGVRGEDPAAAARSYGKLQAWLYPVLGALDRFLWLQFDELRILPDFGSGQPTVEDRVSCRVSAQAMFKVIAAVRVLYEFWRKKVLDIFLECGTLYVYPDLQTTGLCPNQTDKGELFYG